MSVLSVQIGQCGNQLGAELFRTIYDDCFGHKVQLSSSERNFKEDSLSTFFHENVADGGLEARCVQVDMEEKVIARLRRTKRRATGWRYPDKNSYTAKCGSGNNWAYGFFVHAHNIVEKLEAPVQRQLERCDQLDGLLITMSLAGGTGSGVGTKLLLHLPDLLPKTPTLVQLVWPYCRGEVSVQAYNTILTLGHLLSSHTASDLDGFLMQHNDVLHNICSSRLLASNPNCQIGIDQLNSLAAHQLAGILQPFRSSGSTSSTGCHRRLSSMLLHLCGHPDYRLLRPRCLPYYGPECRAFATETWAQLARHGRQMLLTGSASEDRLDWSTQSSGVDAANRFRRNRLPLLGCFAVLRGHDAHEHVQQPASFAHELTRDLLVSTSVSCPPTDASFIHGHDRPFLGYPRSLFVVSNGGGSRLGEDILRGGTLDFASTGDPAASLNYAISRAWGMFASKAYLHQYERYGLTSELLMDCFANVEQAAHCYSSLPWT
ncbi:hypothetical protein CRM22_011013 [Opisthorchis felineus]|uniref:Tubulin delta chain n=2 Tax=Opisthorchis felineus TaxID=147828 RepID=A0A4S2KJF6_OPIFE|nr:hypothetical protein CRM22_011013 [Opisthorchis felineus]TGZ47818.1 hypothetical protein CRM22_011013 [Opisthorchis felineus]TGZ47819.1 hypothetical protein CRM22_011013 [Opisthorchis felineus]